MLRSLTRESTDDLRENAPIKAGDRVALSGNTGGSSGPHLHLEYVRPDGTQFDPTPCIASRIEVTPGSSTLGFGGTATLQARVIGLSGADLTGSAPLSWSSGDGQMATVNASGQVRANDEGRTGTTQVRAALGRVQGSATIAVNALVGSWAGSWTNVSEGNTGGMWLTVQIDGSTATGTGRYSNSTGVYSNFTYQGTATATTLRIVHALGSGGTQEIDLTLAGTRLTGSIVDQHPTTTGHFSVSLARDIGGTAALLTTPAHGSDAVAGPQPGVEPFR